MVTKLIILAQGYYQENTGDYAPGWAVLIGVLFFPALVVCATIYWKLKAARENQKATVEKLERRIVDLEQKQNEDIQTRNGLILRSAREKSIQLDRLGTTQDDVISLLGKPDETSSGTYGTATKTPWPGKEWGYTWIKPDGDCHSLQILFSFDEKENAWVVNNWYWC
jgi:hypothetical protein